MTKITFADTLDFNIYLKTLLDTPRLLYYFKCGDENRFYSSSVALRFRFFFSLSRDQGSALPIIHSLLDLSWMAGWGCLYLNFSV